MHLWIRGVFIEKNSFKSNTYYAEKVLDDTSCDSECNAKASLNIVKGQAEDYNISWLYDDGKEVKGSLTQENLCPGTNIVAVLEPKKKGCTQQININFPDVISAEANITRDSGSYKCNGTIALNVMGGVAPYTFEWSNESKVKNQEGLCEGEYTVTITDSKDCQHTATFYVPQKRKGSDKTRYEQRFSHQIAKGRTGRVDGTAE